MGMIFASVLFNHHIGEKMGSKPADPPIIGLHRTAKNFITTKQLCLVRHRSIFSSGASWGIITNTPSFWLDLNRQVTV